MSIQESIRYGAAELKRFYNRNLGMALGISVGFHLLLIFFYIFVSNAKTRDAPKSSGVPVVRLITPPSPPTNDPPPSSLPPTITPLHPGVGGLADHIAGNPVTVPDALVDTTDFAPIDLIASALPHPGDGPRGEGTDREGIGGPIDLAGKPLEMKEKEKEKEEIPEPEFVAVEKEPEFDLEELHRRVVYPEIARRYGIEGKVTVQVYVDKRGKPVKVKIAQSDNKILEQAAADAVMRTAFTPAIQNGIPIGVWVTIPIDFQLH